MKDRPRAGAEGRVAFTVATAHTIDFGAPGVPPVLSTPSLIWHIEHAAIEALRPFLAPGEISLGAEVRIEHLAPTPVGAEVACTARIVGADGSRVLFQVEARDGRGVTIARGLHRRAVVSAGRFAKSVPRP